MTGPPVGASARLSGRSIRCEVLPDLLDYLGIHDPRISLVGLLLRIQHDLHGRALRPECAGIKDVETFCNRLGVRYPLFDLEWMDGRHLSIATEGPHPRES